MNVRMYATGYGGRNGVTTACDLMRLSVVDHTFAMVAPCNEESAATFNGSLIALPSRMPRQKPDYRLFRIRGALRHMQEQASLSVDTRPDAVLAHDPYVGGMMAWRLARAWDTPLMAHHHTDLTGSYHDAYVPWLPRPLHEFEVRTFYNACDLVTVSTEFFRRKLMRLGVTAHTEIFRFGVEDPKPDQVGPEARQRARRKLGVPQRAQVIAFAGRLDAEKNLGLLLRAFARLQHRVPEAHLLMLGDGAQRETLEVQAIACGIPRQRITWTGHLPRPLLLSLLCAADVAVSLAPGEALGLALMEAMARGAAGLAIDQGGAQESILDGVTGRICHEHPDDIAATLHQMLDCPDCLAALQEAARNAYRGSLERMGRRGSELLALAAELHGKSGH